MGGDEPASRRRRPARRLHRRNALQQVVMNPQLIVRDTGPGTLGESTTFVLTFWRARPGDLA